MSVENTDPGTFIGGTWQRIQDTFLLAAGSTYAAGGSGGNASHTHTYAHTHTTPATTTDSHTLTEAQLPVIDGSMTWHGQEHGTHIYNISGHVTGSKINGMYQTTGQTSGAYSYGSTGFKFGGGRPYPWSKSHHNKFTKYFNNRLRFKSPSIYRCVRLETYRIKQYVTPRKEV